MKFDAIAVREEEKKKRSKKTQKQIDTINLVYPITGITENNVVKTKVKGKEWFSLYLDIKPYDLSYLSEEEYNFVARNYWNMHKQYHPSLKEIYMAFPEENEEQQAYYREKIKHTTNPVHLRYLRQELAKLVHLSDTFISQQSYAVIYGKTIPELETNYEVLHRYGNDLFEFKPFSREKLEKVLFLLNNSNGKPSKNSVDSDLDFIYKTQPQGGVSFTKEFYNRFDNGYGTTIHLVDKPTILNDHWIHDITNIEGAVVTVDYYSDRDIFYTKEISDTIDVTETEIRASNTTAQRDKLTQERDTLRDLSLGISEAGETIKFVSIRIHLREATLEELETKANDLLTTLRADGYIGTIFVNEQQLEWQSLFIPYEQQREQGIRREGIEFPSEALGIGFGHNQTSLKDRTGEFMGVSRTNGTIYLDLFHKDSSRLSYNAFLGGAMGSGKSTLLKKITKANIIRGNHVYGFDASGEFKGVVADMGGTYLQLDGSNGMINMLQVFPTVTVQDEDRNEIDVRGSFDTHISMLLEKLKILNEDFTTTHLKVISDILYRFYIDFGIWDKEGIDITQLPATSYPTLKDLALYNEQKGAEELRDTWKEAHNLLELTLKPLMNQYGKMFNGHTTFPDIEKDQVVFFDITNLTKMESSIFDCQFHTAMNLILASSLAIGRQEKMAYDRGLKKWDELTRCLIINDECHNTLNTEKAYATTVFTTIMSEGRKYFIGIINATQMIERMFPQTQNVSDPKMAVAVEKLKEIVGLSQYKFLLKQDKTSLPFLKTLFGDTFTSSDYNQMEYFEVNKESGSQGILSISGDKNINAFFQVTEDELALFDGGA